MSLYILNCKIKFVVAFCNLRVKKNFEELKIVHSFKC